MDAELVAQAREGNREAFGELVRRHQERVYMTALQLVHSQADADELAQQAFVKAYESLPRFRGDAEFFTWIYRITVNLSLTFLKARNRTVPLPEPSNEEEGAHFELATDERPEIPLEQAQDRERVWKALDRLNPEIKAATILVYIQDLSPKEAAKILGCAEATVHWRLFRARRLLKDFL